MSKIKNCLIIANAESEFNIPQSLEFEYLLALDGAANYLFNSNIKSPNIKKANIKPNAILGDFDSISDDAKEHFGIINNNITKNDNSSYEGKNGVSIIHAFDQSHTDLYKGIVHCLEKFNPQNIFIINSIGGERLDHSIANFYIGQKFSNIKTAKIITIHKNQCIQYIKNNNLSIKGEIKDNIAVFGANTAKVTSIGLKYEMKNFEIEAGVNESTCNELEKKEAIIKVKGGAIIVYPDGGK